MKYLATIFVVDPETAESLSLSREVDTDDKAKVLKLLCKEAGVKKADVDTVLVFANGAAGFGPQVVHHWSGGNGDFS